MRDFSCPTCRYLPFLEGSAWYSEAMLTTSELKFISLTGIIISFSLLAYAATSPQSSRGEIPGKYIVVLKDNVVNSDAAINDIEKKHGVAAEMRYSRVIKGFSANLSSMKLAKMKMDSRVRFVSEDRVVTIDAKPASAGGGSSSAPAAPAQSNRPVQAVESVKAEPSKVALPEQASETAKTIIEEGVGNGKPRRGDTPASSPVQPVQTMPAGIARIGAGGLVNKGTGIGVAVLDTGIDLTHPDLVANIAPVSKTCIARTSSAQDDNGHGTHVAGTIAASHNAIGVVGVAPEAKLYAVKVLDKDGAGSWSSIICGIDWVTENAGALNIRVANMSLGGAGTSDNNCGLSNNDALHAAICNSTRQGVTYVVAAGNSAADAAQSVPASYDDTVITVSALVDTDGAPGALGQATSYGTDDTFATFSNYGSPVDIGAPGMNILSTWKAGAYNTISGTSMAAPHVAGAVALFLRGNPSSTWTQVRDALRFIGEPLNAGHTDPSNRHSEPVLKSSAL